VVTDRPVSKGGTDQGPKGGELLLPEKLVTIAERACIVANTLKEAAPITVVAELRPR